MAPSHRSSCGQRLGQRESQALSFRERAASPRPPAAAGRRSADFRFVQDCDLAVREALADLPRIGCVVVTRVDQRVEARHIDTRTHRREIEERSGKFWKPCAAAYTTENTGILERIT